MIEGAAKQKRQDPSRTERISILKLLWTSILGSFLSSGPPAIPKLEIPDFALQLSVSPEHSWVLSGRSSHIGGGSNCLLLHLAR